MDISDKKDYSEDIIYIAIKRSIDSGDNFAVLASYPDKDQASTVAERIEPIIADKYDFGNDISISVGVEEEGDKFYVVARPVKLSECKGKKELDKYCKACGTFHFDLEGLNSAEAERKKKAIYAEHYKSIRDKNKDQKE